MQDIGTGTKTAMAQIAAEELGIPLDHVTVSLGDSARGPYAAISAGSSTTPSMGPAVRAAAADAKRQIIEIAAQRYHLEERTLDIRGGKVVSSDGNLSTPLEDVVGLLEDAQILGKGARGPNPTGMQVLTFGVQVAEVAVDVETGEVWVDRIAAIHDVGRVINPLGASSQIEGGIIQGIGHTLSEERLHDPRTGAILTTGLDAYKLPTIADVPEIVSELVDEPDAHLTNLGSKGLGEPPIIPTAAAIANAIRDATGADVRCLPITREEMLRALREASRAHEGEGWSSGGRLAPTRSTARRRSHGGTEVVPLLRAGLLDADDARRHPRLVPRGIDGDRIGAGATLAELEGDPQIPDGAARGVPACGEPAAAQHGLARRQPPTVDALLVLAARAVRAACTAATSASHVRASTVSTRSSPTTSALRRIRPTSRPRCSLSARRCGRTGANCRCASSTACRRRTTAARRRSSRASSCSRSRCRRPTRRST